ncbi:hypothetical protein ACF0H5_002174 [Mactra antiquata]
MSCKVRQLKVKAPLKNVSKASSTPSSSELDLIDCISMSDNQGSALLENTARGTGIKLLKTARHYHPKKSHLKRHLKQDNVWNEVLVEPAQYSGQSNKKLKSDLEWDLLFYNNELPEEPVKKKRTSVCQSKQGDKQSFFVRGKEMKSYFKLLDDELIQDFLCRDKCMKITDKYLLAMVFAYFKRAGYRIQEYTRMNFFVALYLANDMEEDEEEMKYEIFPWALGDKWRDTFPRFLSKRDKLWCKIDHRAVVSRCCCEQIMAIEPDNVLWKRNRPDVHGGALRSYMKSDDDDGYPRGPDGSPKKCPECDRDSQYDSASPFSISWYVSSGGSSPDDDIFPKAATHQSSFDMNGLKKTLPKDKRPKIEE